MSLGRFGTSTGATDLWSSLSGAVGAITVKGAIRGGGMNSGRITFPLDAWLANGFGKVTSGGSLVGGYGQSSGRIVTGLGKTGPITIQRSLVGGYGENSGGLSIASTAPRIEIGGSIDSGPGLRSAHIEVVELGPLIVKGAIRGTASRPVSILAHGIDGSAAPAVIDSIVVGGGIERGVIGAVKFATTGFNGHIGSVTIGGDTIVTSIVSAVTNSNGIFGNGDDDRIDGNTSSIGAVKIGGRIVGSEAFETLGIVARAVGAIRNGGEPREIPAAGALVSVGLSNADVHVLT